MFKTCCLEIFFSHLNQFIIKLTVTKTEIYIILKWSKQSIDCLNLCIHRRFSKWRVACGSYLSIPISIIILFKANYVLLMIKGRNLQMHWIKLIFEKFLNINNFLCENRHSRSLKRQFTSRRNQKVHWNNNKKSSEPSSLFLT